MLLLISVLLKALDAEHAENTFLRDERQIDHRGGRLRQAAIFQGVPGVFVGSDVLRILSGDVVQQNRLAMFDTPYGQLILVLGAARVWGVALAVFDGKRVFDQISLRPV